MARSSLLGWSAGIGLAGVGLHRLFDVDQGTDTGNDGSINTLKFEQQWTLDQLGNWSTFTRFR